MPADRFDLVGEDALEQGATWDFSFSLGDLDPTGGEVRLQMRKDYAVASPPILKLSSLGGADSPDGSITIIEDTENERGEGAGVFWADCLVTDETLEGVATDEWSRDPEEDPADPAGPFFGVWDAEVELASGVCRRLLEGRVQFKPEVTR